MDVYLQISQRINIYNTKVYVKDFATVYCNDILTKHKIENLFFYEFNNPENNKLIISALTVIQQITNKIPDITIHNIGEADFVLIYTTITKAEKWKEILFTIFICLTAFLGGGYAIMSYNTDVGALELFSNLSMIVLGNARSGTLLLTISYSLGLFIGLIVFFNHLGSKKINDDPTPLEIQMHNYEKDINTSIIKSANQNNHSMLPKE